MRTRVLLAVTVAALLLAGCNDDGDDVSSGVVTTVGGDATATTIGGGSTTTAPAVTALVLRNDGVGPVTFGATKSATVSTLDDVLGPVEESGAGCELIGPNVTTVRWKELRLQFVGDSFDSYNVRPPDDAAPVLGLKTEAGIGLGSTVAELQAAYGSRLEIPGLPPEFGGKDFAISFAGPDRTILGSLSDTTATGTVTAIFTQVCE